MQADPLVKKGTAAVEVVQFKAINATLELVTQGKYTN